MPSDQKVSDQALFDELSFHTLSHPDPAFLHENGTEAGRAQYVDDA
jgi:hypothetical protein